MNNIIMDDQTEIVKIRCGGVIISIPKEKLRDGDLDNINLRLLNRIKRIEELSKFLSV